MTDRSVEGDRPEAPLGLLCALPAELARLEAAVVDRADASRGPLRATRGRLDGRAVVIAETGVGKVSAALAATVLADNHGCGALVMSGVAGGLGTDLAIGDVVVASRVVDADYGRATDAGFVPYQPGSLPLPEVLPAPGYDLAPHVARGVRAAIDGLRLEDRLGPGGSSRRVRVELGTIVSGDVFVASGRVRDELVRRWAALAVEMEGSAVCGVAERYGLPWLVVRALSDRAGEASVVDFQTFVAAAADTAASVVRRLLPALSGR